MICTGSRPDLFQIGKLSTLLESDLFVTLYADFIETKAAEMSQQKTNRIFFQIMGGVLVIIGLICFLMLFFNKRDNSEMLMENRSEKYSAKMNWQEVGRVFNNGTLVVIPIGAGCKEHGLHLPNNADQIQVEYFAAKLAEQSDILIMPTVTYNYYPVFVHYPGSASLSADVSAQTFVQMCEMWYQQGARSFYFLNYGVSTNTPLKEAQQILRTKNIEMRFTDLSLFEKMLRELPEDQRPKQEGGTHADEVETGIMLAINPSLVNMKLAQKDFDNQPGPFYPVKPAVGTRGRYSPTGAWGDPTLATAERGKVFLEKMIEFLLDDIKPQLKHS